MSEVFSLQELKNTIAINDIREFQFSDKQTMAAGLAQIGQSDITAADLPDFNDGIRFTSAEWVDLITKIERQTTAEKKNIIRQTIMSKTQYRTADLRSDVDSMEAEKKKIKDALADLSPNKIESSLLLMETLLGYVPEQHRMLLGGYAGSLILDTFEKHNQRIVLMPDNTVEVTPIDRRHATPAIQQNNMDLSLRLNALIQGGRLDTNVLKTGMLYRAGSFASYSANIRDTNGHVLNPETVQNPQEYLAYLQKKKDSGLSLSAEDETILASEGSFHNYPLMIPAIEQFKDIGKISREAKVVANEIQQQMAPTGASQDGAGEKLGDKTSNNGTASAVGEGIGKLGGTIGKLAAAGANGGMKVFGEVLNSAVKEGGPWGAAAVIGGLIYSIFKAGFWKTLGAIFGIGLMSEASAGRVNLDLDGTSKKTKGSDGKPSEQVEGKKVPTSVPEKAKNIPDMNQNYTNFLTSVAGLPADKISESKEILAKFDNIKYSEAEEFVREGKINDRIVAILGDTKSPEYNARKEVLKRYITSLTTQDAKKNGLGEVMDNNIRKKPQYANWTMKEVTEYIFDLKERANEVSTMAEHLAQQATSPEDAVALRETASRAREAAEKGDVEGVYFYSSAIEYIKNHVNEGIAFTVGGVFVWKFIKEVGKNYKNWGVVKAGNWVGGKFVGAGKWAVGKGVGAKNWTGDKITGGGKGVEAPTVSKALKIDRSILSIESLTAAEKAALESIIQKTEELAILEDKLGSAGRLEKFSILRDKTLAGKEIKEVFVQNPNLVRKLETVGEGGNKVALELADFAKNISKIEIGSRITKILKIFKKI